MDDLNEEPQKVAEDIIEHATKGLGFKQGAICRIFDILTAYHQIQEELAGLKKQVDSDCTDVEVVGEFAFKKNKENQIADRCCAYCYRREKVLIQLVDMGNMSWKCVKCDKIVYDISRKPQYPSREVERNF
jgi:hypothetical protein